MIRLWLTLSKDLEKSIMRQSVCFPWSSISVSTFDWSYYVNRLVPVWLYSLFDSSQNVSHIYKQLLCKKVCWKSRSTCSILFCLWILVKFCYSISTRKVIIFLVNQNIQWWDVWLVISQMFLFVITSISVS